MEDLSLFTNTDFFDYDVFAKDVAEINKNDNPENIDAFLSTISNIEPESIFNTGTEEPTQEFIKPSLLVSPSSATKVIPAIKEDKKKRNTAASARFRIKKKQKQQEMELKIAKLNEDISTFTNQIKKLEIENKILKGLVFDKSNSTLSKDDENDNNSTQRTVPSFLTNSEIHFQYTI